ncbi:MAG: type II toxin-antitoxin system prevent-host-death family antitoxin [Ardenticatenaceae bacterium]|nr:type II toxin-antitoxin system prevent-host-death family antitoxin [Ardenticatenaceae bacterium]
MKTTVGAYEAKTHLPKLLERVSKGDRIIITKHGVPVAVLQGFDAKSQVNLDEVIADIKAFRAKITSSGPTIREMIEEGRR